MIVEVKMYTVICDNCGTDVNKDSEYSAWNDKNFAENVAMESDWIKEGDKHFCNYCWSHDEDDKVVLKRIEPITNKTPTP